MTNLEFDTQFDIFYNNIASNAAPSVDLYEKSVFLTQAQRDIVLELYNGRGTPGISFESTEEVRRYLSNLVKTYDFNVDSLDTLIELPSNLLFIIREEAICGEFTQCLKGKTIDVVPSTHDNLNKELRNPFKGPSRTRVLRVDVEGKIKLYSKYKISNYKITYLENPSPIILGDLGSELTIEGKSSESTSNVNPILHRAILERAVLLAKMAYIGK